MRHLLSATSLLPFVAILAGPAAAETVISDARTTPVTTAAVGDSIRISSTGSVKPAAPGAAVTVNSSHSVTNQGTIAFTGANGSTGILIQPGNSGTVTNEGTITLDETYSPTDSDNDGDVDGPFAQGTDRFGIRLLSGGTFTGDIVNSGKISIEGNNSAAIQLDGTLAGSLRHSGTIEVLGDHSAGIRTSAVSGDIALTNGSISVKGAGSVGLDVTGAVGGKVSIQSAITATGYRSTTAPADPSKLDADDLLQGGPAVHIGADVAGGLIVDVRPADASTTDTDEDDDGLADAQEGNGQILSYGAAPAVLVGSTSGDIAIGALAGNANGHGFVNKGQIGAAGVYKGVASTAVQIGGTGHAATIAGGLTNSGTIAAKSVEANATALLIGAGGSVPTILNSGTINAEGGGTATSGAVAIDIAAGGSVTTIKNSGTISATRAGTSGTATAIIDRSGTLSLIENSGTISVADAATLGDKAVAFDLSANAAGATVRQLAVTGTTAAPAIRGTMIFGAGNDLMDLQDGTAQGTLRFGAGTDELRLSGDALFEGAVAFDPAGADRIALSGTSRLAGTVDFNGATGDFALSDTAAFAGTLKGAGAVAVNVGAGTRFALANTSAVALGSLSTGAGSTLGVTIDGTTGAHTLYDVAGAVTIGGDTDVAVTLTSVANAVGSYVILKAGGGLTGGADLTSSATSLPFLFGSALAVNDTTDEVTLTIRRKTATELGLNQSEGAILSAVLGAVDKDAGIRAALLSVTGQEQLSDTLQQMLPDHAGGTFESATRAVRMAARRLTDPTPRALAALDDGSSGWSVWLNQAAWGTSKSVGATSSYDLGSWGASGGVERDLGKLGSLGLSLAYSSTKDGDDGDGVRSNQYEGALSWRGGTGPLHGYARVGLGRVKSDSVRAFEAVVGGTPVARSAEADWNGTLASALVGAAYELEFDRLNIRPAVQLEHFSLKEKGYAESGGGEAFDLVVDDRKSSETAASATVTAGYALRAPDPTSSAWLRVELEGGRREILSGKLGSTTARFVGGTPFTLDPEQRDSGWLGRLRLVGGGLAMSIAGEVEAEELGGRTAIGGRASLRFGL